MAFKLVIMTSIGPNAMAETTIEFETKQEMKEFLKKRNAEKKAKRDKLTEGSN